jgi:hypothetical protein
MSKSADRNCDENPLVGLYNMLQEFYMMLRNVQ